MAVDACVIACLGDNCLDLYLPPVDRVFVGGSCLNVAVGLSRRGLRSAYLGPVGADRAGEAVRRELAVQDVDGSHVRVVESENTALTEIALEDDGERRFLSESYEIHESYDPAEADWAFIAAARHVHASRIPRHLERLLEIGAHGSSVSYDFSADPLPARLDGLALAFLSHDVLPAATRAEVAAQELVRRGCACVVITLGEQGSVGTTATELVALDAAPAVDVRDTCGAGDAFIAAFLVAYLAGAPLRACLEAGSIAGAEACSMTGPFPQAGVSPLAAT